MVKNRNWKHELYVIIFEAETKAGRLFDLILIGLILLSVTVICLESVKSINQQFGNIFVIVEWSLTIVFACEYLLRLVSLKKPMTYIFSFFGIIDLLAILPSFIGLFFKGAHALMVIRSIRLLRVFRLLGLTTYTGEAELLVRALKSGRQKVTVFLLGIFTIAIFMGALMFIVEGEEGGFTSIPKGMYWAIVTMTTVGYGDIAPHSNLGKALASILMVMGYGIIAVPTGIVSAEMVSTKVHTSTITCSNCLLVGHNRDAHFCRICGEALSEQVSG